MGAPAARRASSKVASRFCRRSHRVREENMADANPGDGEVRLAV